MTSTTIKLFLASGESQRLRTAEISNWNGKAIAAPRTELDQLLEREELRQPGVYLLNGTNPDSGKPLVYIDEAEVIRDRLRQQKEKDFWVQVVVFVSKELNLTKAHIRYLEGRLIEDASSAWRVELANSTSSGARLPESDREDMEVFLAKTASASGRTGHPMRITRSAPGTSFWQMSPACRQPDLNSQV